MSKLNVTTSTTRPASPNTGSIFFETDTNKLIFWDGSVWHMFDRDSVTAAAPSNTLTFELSFISNSGGETSLQFSIDDAYTTSVNNGAGTMHSYSAQGVANTDNKYYVAWSDNGDDSSLPSNAGSATNTWAGWALYVEDTVNSPGVIDLDYFNYMSHIPYLVAVLRKYSWENATGSTWSGWDHSIASPFDLDVASLDSSSTGDWEIAYDGLGQDGENSDLHLLTWDVGGGWSMDGAGQDRAAFEASRSGSVPS